jgi:hypothetical protein
MITECKNGEHRALTNVYFIPRLRTSIISVGKLDEDGHEVKIKHGIMLIRDEYQRLLTWIHSSLGRMYWFELQIAQPVCLSAHDG